MKKIFLLLTFSLFLTSCFSSTNKEDIENAKHDLLSWTSQIESSTNSWLISDDNFENNSSDKISINYLTQEKFLEIDNFSISDFEDLEQEITWKTLENVDKIIVSFSNSSSKFKDSSFELKKFKSGDEKFLYRAFKKYESLDYWENIYTFEAHSWGKISKLEYKVILDKVDDKEEKEIKEPISLDKLPSSSVFWNPVSIWNWKVTYSDIKWLEIEQIWEVDLVNSESSVTEFLKNKLKNLFYWNTKRNISWDKWLSFFVVRIEKDKYFYEKHYYTWNFYWILSLETWDFTAEWTIEEKAKSLSELSISLKEKNSSFPTEKIANLLFQDILK